MKESSNSEGTIRLLGSKDKLAAQFEPPLPEIHLFRAILKHCPVLAFDKADDGQYRQILYDHAIYGVQDEAVKVNAAFINGYREIANDLGRTISGRNMNTKIPLPPKAD